MSLEELVENEDQTQEINVAYHLSPLFSDFKNHPFDSKHRLLISGDFNGDGFDDLFAVKKESESTNSGKNGYLFIGSALGIAYESPIQKLEKNEFKFFDNVDVFDYVTSDLNNDGRDDLLVLAKTLPGDSLPHGKHYSILSEENGELKKIHQKINPVSQTWAASFSDVLVKDFNGDGLPDLFFQGKDNTNVHHLIYGNTDTKFKKQNSVEFDGGFDDGDWHGDASSWVSGKYQGNGQLQILRIPNGLGFNNDNSQHTDNSGGQNNQETDDVTLELKTLEPVTSSIQLVKFPPPEDTSTPLTPPYLNAPTTDIDGAFLVKWGSSVNQYFSKITYVLEQQKNSGSYIHSYIGASSSTGEISQQISGLSDGIYRYRIQACYGSNCLEQYCHCRKLCSAASSS